jgi:hypothetical protein
VPALRDLQALFKEGLLATEEEAIADLVVGDGLDPSARLAVYRHHVLTTLTATLEAAFPVVCRLVDRRFFAYAADVFIRRHPPTGPCLAEYGAAFPDFVAGFAPCTPFPFLPDVARLEWAIHLASEAPPTGDLDIAYLRGVDPLDMAALRFGPCPGLAYVASAWPVDRIWSAHREGEAEPLADLDAGSVYLEISAAEEGVRLRVLGRATYAFRDALARGLTLGEAADSAFTLDSSFDLSAELRMVLEGRLFTDCTVVTPEGG